MNATIDILDTVLLNFRIVDGEFLATLGDDTVKVNYLLKDSKGNTWVEYITPEGETIKKKHYDAEVDGYKWRQREF